MNHKIATKISWKRQSHRAGLHMYITLYVKYKSDMQHCPQLQMSTGCSKMHTCLQLHAFRIDTENLTIPVRWNLIDSKWSELSLLHSTGFPRVELPVSPHSKTLSVFSFIWKFQLLTVTSASSISHRVYHRRGVFRIHEQRHLSFPRFSRQFSVSCQMSCFLHRFPTSVSSTSFHLNLGHDGVGGGS